MATTPTDDPTPPRPTATRMRELENDLANERRRVAELTTERDAWRDAHRKDDEAATIEVCAKALASLLERGRSGATHYHFSEAPPQVERVLRYLALRFGVVWPDPRIPEVLTVVAQEDIRAGEQVDVSTADSSARRVPPDPMWR